jgi:peptidoglycan hydrolase-like protein with peptidoglycan-binding domain
MSKRKYEGAFLAYLKALGIKRTDYRKGKNDFPYEGSRTGYRKIQYSDRKGVCVHHAAGRASFQGYAKGHISRWDSANGIAYSMGINFDGSVGLFWDFDIRTYAQGWSDDSSKPESLGDENKYYLGVLVNGNMKGPHNPGGTDEPTVEQLDTLKAILAFFETLGWDEVTGHYRHGKVACPGQTLENVVESLRANKSLTSIIDEAKKSSTHVDSVIDLSTKVGRQTALKVLVEPALVPDGIWGNASKQALMKFQKQAGLTADGLWGPNTEAAITDALKRRS